MGSHALRVLQTDSQFDVVITDYAMPGMKGLDLANHIRQIRPMMPIIIATGYAELPVNATIGFPRLSKPYTQHQLAEALENAARAREFQKWCSAQVHAYLAASARPPARAQ